MSRVNLFEPDGSGLIECRLCGRKFRRWNGTSTHGLKHVGERKATCGSDPHTPSTSGHRYRFWVTEKQLRERETAS